jgi:hypothetical protein
MLYININNNNNNKKNRRKRKLPENKEAREGVEMKR